MKHIFLFLILFPAIVFGQSINSDTLPKPQSPNSKLPVIRVAAQVGYGYRNAYITQSTYYSMQERKLVSVSNSMKNHLQKLNHNISYGADFSYFFIKHLGIGLKYNGISGHASSSEVLFPFEDGAQIRGSGYRHQYFLVL